MCPPSLNLTDGQVTLMAAEFKGAGSRFASGVTVVTTRLAGAVHYDKQTSEYRDEMTYVEPESGVRTSRSWLMPNTHPDSARKRHSASTRRRMPQEGSSSA